MPNCDHYVIIGNGPAGNHAAETLRKHDPNTRITIISHENIPFYYKPKLTEYITGNLTKKDLMVCSLNSYKKQNIRLRLGQAVTQINTKSQTITLKHMEEIHYSKLIIASGSKGRIMPSMLCYADCLKLITSYKDVYEFRDKIKNSNDFFIFGGDLVGFKFLKMLIGMNKNVTLLICPSAFWPFRLTLQMAKSIITNLAKTGANIMADDDIKHISKENSSYIIKTKKGIKKKVDMVFSCNGLIPCVDFARGGDLDIDHGILVNKYMQSNIDNIYACGSCAQIYNDNINSYTTSIGWPNAVMQGEVTAMNIMGKHNIIQYAKKKYFDLEGIKIKTTWWEDFDEEL